MLVEGPEIATRPVGRSLCFRRLVFLGAFVPIIGAVIGRRGRGAGRARRAGPVSALLVLAIIVGDVLERHRGADVAEGVDTLGRGALPGVDDDAAVGWVSTPPAPRSRRSPLGMRPIAASSVSASTTLPSSSARDSAPAQPPTEVTSRPSRTPWRALASSVYRCATVSSCEPSNRCACSTSTISDPSAENTWANSAAMRHDWRSGRGPPVSRARALAPMLERFRITAHRAADVITTRTATAADHSASG